MHCVKEFLDGLTLGEAQNYKNMSLIPLFTENIQGLDYLILSQALEKGAIVVDEVSKAGSVGELRVKNKGDQAVLVLDGEELSGAKQNRVLNTTILIAAGSDIIIPVSCTEAGRWSRKSAFFAESGNFMTPNIRAAQNKAVTESLKMAGEDVKPHMRFRANQGETWERISQIHDETGTFSATGAMSDAYKQRDKDLKAYLKKFEKKDGQVGTAVIIDSRVVGFEVISKPAAFSGLFKKLIKSYAMEALISEGADLDAKLAPNLVELFIDKIKKAKATRHESVGLGKSVRLKGEGIVGSALEYQDYILHCACFHWDDSDDTGAFASFNQRRSFRW